ncbi:MAG: T9SS type A sorting domain-containing protein, partial [Calditrichia bacterium]
TFMEGIGLVQWIGEGFGWFFRGAIINGTQYGTITSVEKPKVEIPDAFELYQNYPNPFNAQTTISYRVIERSNIQITIYDVRGKMVRKLVDEKNQLPGEYSSKWNGKDKRGGDAASGIYFYQLRAGNFVETKRALLIK